MPPITDNPARIRDVCDAIALELNATLAVKNESDNSAITPARFTAARTYGVDYDNVTLKTLHVDVRPPIAAMEAESRGGSDDTYEIEIAVQKAVLKTDLAAIDLLTDLTYHVGRYFCPRKILGVYGNVLADQVQVQETILQLYAPDKIAQGRYFGLVTLTLKEYVDR